MKNTKTNSTEELFGAAMPTMDSGTPALSFFEFWPGWLFYLPVKLYALWLGLRYGGLNTLTAANPRITAGGFVGETKSELHDLLSPKLSQFLPETLICEPPHEIDKLEQKLNFRKMMFPLVAKPDLGCRGSGVQKIQNTEALEHYLKNYPDQEKLILQECINDEGEAGVFYIRHPEEDRGQIFSLTLKYFPYMRGDGHKTLRELIYADPRAKRLTHFYFPRHKEHLDRILQEGEMFRLSFAGTHSQGAIFKDGNQYITEKMTDLFDNISKQIPDFYFGRYDVRFPDFSALETGVNLKIIELNGASAEATHIWDSKTSLWDAYKTQFAQYRHAYQIGEKNIKTGHMPTAFKAALALIKAHNTKTKSYPPPH